MCAKYIKAVVQHLILCLAVFGETCSQAGDGGYLPPDSKVVSVYRAGQRSNFDYARRGQSITIVVTNLESFFNSEVVSNDAQAKHMVTGSQHLVPYINNIPLTGCKLMFDTCLSNRTHKLVFKLNRDPSDPNSKDHWKELFGSIPLLGRNPVTVSVGLTDGLVIDTDVQRHGTSGVFSFSALPFDSSSITGILVILVALILFFKLASRSDIIRDPFAALRPDGQATFSLARTQMAFWFFLVLASYFLLWLLTDDKDTIPASILTLIGISAGTAIGATLVDAGKTMEGQRSQFFICPKTGQTEKQLVQDLVALKQEKESKLVGVLETLENLPATALVDRDNAQKQQRLLEDSIGRTAIQIAFYRSSRWQRFMTDILGDQGSISFHRFQIAAWTLMLGVIFAKEVFTNIAMPDFNSTILGLMGISAGTYVGFKLPETKK